ncbi:MAG: transcriptional regulator AsnC [Candidatus Wallbacteria bacterium HGW-Wallbacteria-1]|jgi:Lrp/AsnC family transcriptional regulator for asnA, asnC and gidA|uniref:Transcriptional regulator AsnC n=1 Tax=Candidatus Wallbacteria bacterium HGW-Wallbacteria-1 TaxID=2013854 RepID=A0A2N1PM70_9BACT|nr:MAG: transcriptional regulator AsnC [Candidatus Wallbacteria bacterium HGW-Wallbacteria-1]
MTSYCDIDTLDRQILAELMNDSRKPFQEIARNLCVSGGTIHVRVNRMRELGIITGSRLMVDHSLLGYDVTALVGINLVNAGDYKKVIESVRKMDEVIEAHYTTGGYSLIIKVIARSTRGLHWFLVEKLQPLKEIQSTETMISLEMPIHRAIDPLME